MTPVATTAERVDQHVHLRRDRAQAGAAARPAWTQHQMKRALVFTRTKHGADRVVRRLTQAGIARRRDPRQQVASRARAGAGRVQGRALPRAGGDRHRRPRHRHRQRLARRELRPAERAGELRPPHRPHRARRGRGHGHLLLRPRGARLPARHRAAHPPEGAGDGRPRRPRRRFRPWRRKSAVLARAGPRASAPAPQWPAPGPAATPGTMPPAAARAASPRGVASLPAAPSPSIRTAGDAVTRGLRRAGLPVRPTRPSPVPTARPSAATTGSAAAELNTSKRACRLHEGGPGPPSSFADLLAALNSEARACARSNMSACVQSPISLNLSRAELCWLPQRA